MALHRILKMKKYISNIFEKTNVYAVSPVSPGRTCRSLPLDLPILLGSATVPTIPRSQPLFRHAYKTPRSNLCRRSIVRTDDPGFCCHDVESTSRFCESTYRQIFCKHDHTRTTFVAGIPRPSLALLRVSWPLPLRALPFEPNPPMVCTVQGK